MKAASCAHASVKGVGEKGAVAVEPSLGLEEAEEEQARAVEQSEVTSFLTRAAIEGTGERFDARLECAVEATSERLAAENLDPALMREHIRVGTRIGGGHKGRERFGVAVDDVVALRHEGGETWRSAVGAPRSDRHRARYRLSGEDDPEDVRRVLRESMRGASHLVRERFTSVELEEECAQRPWSLGDVRALYRLETDLAQQGVVQWQGSGRMTQRGGDGRQALEAGSVGEEARCGAQGTHAGTMPRRPTSSVIAPLRAAPELRIQALERSAPNEQRIPAPSSRRDGRMQ